MRRLFYRAAVTTMAAALVFGACKKPVFVPENLTPPTENDEIGTYEEGFYVTESGAGMFTGEDWTNAFSAEDLKAILLADRNGNFTEEQIARINGKVIHLEEGIYPLASADNPSPRMSGAARAWSVTIKGGYRSGHYVQYPDRHPTYLSGGSDWKIVEIGEGVSLTLDAVGFTGGLAKASGEAVVDVNGGSLKIVGGKVTGNFSSATAGAVQVREGGKFKAENCLFEGNVAQNGGAINIDGASSSCILTACDFSANAVSKQGGAIKVTNGSLYAKGCTFKANHAETRGGALWLAGNADETSVLFEDCVFEGNSSVNGGGVCWTGGNAAATFRGCSFTNNVASNGSAGSFYVNEASGNLIAIEDCTFKGNHGGAYSGGSIHIYATGKSIFKCTGCGFEGEYSGSYGGLISLRGTLAEAYFNNCTIVKCHAVKHSGVFYDYSSGSRLYFNACTFKDNYIEGSYGTEVSTATGYDDVCIGLNNCAVKGSRTTSPEATSQQACWYNIGAVGKFTFSNCSLVGVPTAGDLEMPRYGLVRINHNDANVRFVNNIIVSTGENGYGIYGGDGVNGLTLTGSHNFMSPFTSQVADTFSYSEGAGDRLNVYSNDLPGLNWDGRTWTWSASASGLAPTSEVGEAVLAFDPDFHAWLESIDALGKDINGKGRGNTSWPGSYQN